MTGNTSRAQLVNRIDPVGCVATAATGIRP